MKMNIALKYFSGTGNSYKILDTCNEIFVKNGCVTRLSSVTDTSHISEEADLIGFCFPVYAFGIPRICRQYLQRLPNFKKPIKTFVLVTAGDPDESGFAVMESSKILKKKGLNVTYTRVIHMPPNWTVSMNPPTREEAQLIIDAGVNKARKTARAILEGTHHYHTFNYPARYSKLGFYKDYYLFKWLGLSNLWRDFRTDDTCDACGFCEKICPTKSIQMVDGKPEWTNTCEQCMRCVNYCPGKAIFQKGDGSIKGKNTYYEPTFKPFKKRRLNKAEKST